jgi:cobyric acid synthase
LQDWSSGVNLLDYETHFLQSKVVLKENKNLHRLLKLTSYVSDAGQADRANAKAVQDKRHVQDVNHSILINVSARWK